MHSGMWKYSSSRDAHMCMGRGTCTCSCSRGANMHVQRYMHIFTLTQCKYACAENVHIFTLSRCKYALAGVHAHVHAHAMQMCMRNGKCTYSRSCYANICLRSCVCSHSRSADANMHAQRYLCIFTLRRCKYACTAVCAHILAQPMYLHIFTLT